MKLSALIALLQQAHQTHGDVDVHTYDNESGEYFPVSKLTQRKDRYMMPPDYEQTKTEHHWTIE